MNVLGLNEKTLEYLQSVEDILNKADQKMHEIESDPTHYYCSEWVAIKSVLCNIADQLFNVALLLVLTKYKDMNATERKIHRFIKKFKWFGNATKLSDHVIQKLADYDTYQFKELL